MSEERGGAWGQALEAGAPLPIVPYIPWSLPKSPKKELRVWMKKKRNNKILKFLDLPLVSSALTPSRPSSAP